ncbi:MAG: alpha/beta fold hydrolase [Patescibacteria group bacterium]
MECLIKIRLNKKIHLTGRLRGPLKKPLVIFVHGLTGNMDEHIFYNGARYFEGHGISSFRFNLYDWTQGTRKLDISTLALHASDLDFVVKYFRKRGAKKIFVVGHSYGGPTIMKSKDKDFQGVIFWDPSFFTLKYFLESKWLPSIKMYLCRWAYPVLLSKKYVEEARRTNTLALIQKLAMPIKIITAGKGVLVKTSKKYFKALNVPKELVILDGATHCFDEDGYEEKLFSETLSWVRRCCSMAKINLNDSYDH